MADGRAGGVGDAHRIEDLTLHIAEEEAVRGGGARGWARLRSPLHEGQHVPEDGEVDVVVVRHVLVDLLDALPDLFPCRIAGLEDQVAVEAESCPVGQQFPEGDGVDAWAFDPVRGQERPDPAVDAQMVAGQRLQDGNRGEHLADAEDIHHDVRSHGELRRVCGRAGKAGGNNFRRDRRAPRSRRRFPSAGLSMLRASRLSEMHARGVQALSAEPADADGEAAAGPPAPAARARGARRGQRHDP